MSFSDYLLDIALIAIVFRQIRESRFSWVQVLLPVVLCLVIGGQYLQDLPTAGNDLALIFGFTGVGVVLGLVSGFATRMRRDSRGYTLVKAGAVAAGAWVLGMGFRFAFVVWTTHGGAASLGRFSIEHHITGAAAWTDALVLMAFGEVFVRTAVLAVRARRVQQVGGRSHSMAVI